MLRYGFSDSLVAADPFFSPRVTGPPLWPPGFAAPIYQAWGTYLSFRSSQQPTTASKREAEQVPAW